MISMKEYEERAIPRLRILDCLSNLCQWDKFDFEVSFEVQQKRERWKKLMDEQMADEVAAGL